MTEISRSTNTMKQKHTFISAGLITVALLGLVACGGIKQPVDVAMPAGNTVVLTQPDLPAANNTVAQAALQGTLEEIYKQVSPSVVHIQVVQASGDNNMNFPVLPEIPGFPNFPDLPQSNTPVRGEGSGFVWDKEGHVVTNNHVIENADQITVVFADGRMADGTLVGADRDSDLAILKVDVPEDRLQPVRLADSTTLQVGDLAIAIGNPFGQEGTMTAGIISALGRLLPVETASLSAPHYNIPDVIQTDAAINPGNSGGVLLNDKGEVIGVTSAILSAVRSSSGVGFAIPSAIVQQVVPALIADGHYDHPYVGISGTSLTPDLAQEMDLPEEQRGALVIEVMPNSPADESDLKGGDKQVEIDGQQALIGGDVIIAASGRPIHSMDDLITDLSRFGKVNEVYPLTVLRDGRERTIELTLASRPESDSQATIQSAESTTGDAYLGILGIDLTSDMNIAMDLPQDQAGVLVVQVEAHSPADDAGLHGSYKPLDVNGQQLMVGGDVITAVNGDRVTSMQGLRTTLAQASPGDKVDLTVLRDGKEMTIRVELGERNK
jgi:serine protease Do